MRTNSREQLQLAQSIQDDALEAFCRIRNNTARALNGDTDRSQIRRWLVENEALELKLTTFHDNDAETELKIRMLGSSAISSVNALIVETKKTEREHVTTTTYGVQTDDTTGESEFTYQSLSTDPSKTDYPLQTMPGGAVEELTHVLLHHNKRN